MQTVLDRLERAETCTASLERENQTLREENERQRVMPFAAEPFDEPNRTMMESDKFTHLWTWDGEQTEPLSIGDVRQRGGNSSELWAFDGRSWEQPAQQRTDAPSQRNQRSWHATTFDEARDQVMLFGGMAGPMRWLRVFSDPLVLKW